MENAVTNPIVLFIFPLFNFKHYNAAAFIEVSFEKISIFPIHTTNITTTEGSVTLLTYGQKKITAP